MSEKLGTNLAGVGTDTISRRAAINALSNEIVKRRLLDEMYDGCIDEFQTEEILKKLPPAQPETATVTIGRTKGSVTMWYECDACGEPVDQKDNYCRNCGRKLKYD